MQSGCGRLLLDLIAHLTQTGRLSRLHPQVSGFTTEPPEPTAEEVTFRIAQITLTDGSLLRLRALMSVEINI